MAGQRPDHGHVYLLVVQWQRELAKKRQRREPSPAIPDDSDGEGMVVVVRSAAETTSALAARMLADKMPAGNVPSV
jgi:hypothetical protein